MKKTIIALLFALFLIVPPTLASAEEETPKFTPQVNVGESFQTKDPVEIGSKYESSTGDIYFRASLLPKYIQAIYQYGQGVVGILAVIILMVGGVIWITSAGDSGKIGQAKKMILGSITGIIILFSSWIILNTINPDLTNLQALDIKVVERETRGCCESTGGMATMISREECESYVGTTFYENGDKAQYLAVSGHCEEFKFSCNVRYDCSGNVNWCADTTSGTLVSYTTDCGGVEKSLSKLIEAPCSTLSSCTSKRINCTGVQDGQLCPSSDSGGKVLGIAYCYDELCLTGLGKVGERCGEEKGAFCSEESCNNIGKDNEEYDNDRRGGRDCESELSCCYKN